MQSLNLSGSSTKSDGWLKSLFWPTVENAWDVDYLGQQGFWICLIIGAVSSCFISVTGFELVNPVARTVELVLAGIVFFVYFIGGMGVRESNWPAAVSIFTIYVVNLLGTTRVPGILPVIIGAVLLSNVRATFLASRWAPISQEEDRPTRFNETLRDKLVDQLPPKAWPILKVPFFIAAVLLLGILIYTFGMGMMHPLRATDDSAPAALVTP